MSRQSAVFRALRRAGVDESDAQEAAEAFGAPFADIDMLKGGIGRLEAGQGKLEAGLARLESEIGRVRTDIAVMKWMLAVIVTGIVALIGRAFF